MCTSIRSPRQLQAHPHIAAQMQEQLTRSSSPLQAACEYFRATRSAHSLGVQTCKLQQIVVRPHTLLFSPFWTQQVTILEDSQLAQTGLQGSVQ